MIQNVNDPSFNQLVEAQRLGFKFMKIYLHRERIGRLQKRITIGGAVSLVGYKKGQDDMGQQAYEFVERRGESMVFDFDAQEREFICWLYDDAGQGYFSETGYNRDLLASHMDFNFFIIKDPELLVDIEQRYDYMKKHPGKKRYKAKPLNEKLTGSMNISDIDNQMKFLQSRKDMLVSLEEKSEKKKAKVKEKIEKIKNEKAKTSDKKKDPDDKKETDPVLGNGGTNDNLDINPDVNPDENGNENPINVKKETVDA